ncbi:hypothetical protein [Actinomadura sp. 9N407]|uniref:hypothetical protein n=1 Tax=Actinomadura sp. 9N407 TaxID=3375154 RepID=UPI00378E5DA4
MKRAIVRATALGCAVLVLSVSAPPASAAGTWRTVPTPFFWPNYGFSDISAEGAGSVWISGVQGSFCIQWMPMTPCVVHSDGNPVVRRWDGTRWREYPITGWTGQGRMGAIESGGGQTWVQGFGFDMPDQRYLARFDGRAFVPAAPPAGTNAVALLRSNPAGMRIVTWTDEGRHAVHRRTGDTWTREELPADLRWVNDLRFRTATDGWAVGMTEPAPNTYGGEEYPAIAHWDGTSWTSVPPHIESGREERLARVAPVAADEVWATTRKSVVRWYGGSWTVVPSPGGIRRPRDLVVDGTGTLWLIAETDAGPSLIFRREGDAWQQVTIPSITSVTNLAAVPGTDTLWGLAGNGTAPTVITTAP